MQLKVHEIGHTYKKLCNSPGKVVNSEVTHGFIKPFFEPYIGVREAMFCIYLNHGNQIIGIQRISEGNISGTLIEPKIILKGAIDLLASSIILAHNHPSGNLISSKADRDVTRKMQEACKLIDVDVLDHLILGLDDKFYSFADEGLMQ
jgi:DNA repair protein RadC